MRLPNSNRAVVDIRKLRDYGLDPTSPKGRSKARVFNSSLGLTQRDAEFLQEALLSAARERNCTVGEADDYGLRYTVDFMLQSPRGQGWLRSGWIVRHDEDFPRLTTCFVITSKARRT